MTLDSFETRFLCFQYNVNLVNVIYFRLTPSLSLSVSAVLRYSLYVYSESFIALYM